MNIFFFFDCKDTTKKRKIGFSHRHSFHYRPHDTSPTQHIARRSLRLRLTFSLQLVFTAAKMLSASSSSSLFPSFTPVFLFLPFCLRKIKQDTENQQERCEGKVKAKVPIKLQTTEIQTITVKAKRGFCFHLPSLLRHKNTRTGIGEGKKWRQTTDTQPIANPTFVLPSLPFTKNALKHNTLPHFAKAVKAKTQKHSNARA